MEITTIDDSITRNFSDAETVKTDIVSNGFSWDEREELFYGVLKGDDKARTTHSTGELQTIVIDSSCRIMAQMPTGKFTGIGDTTKQQVIIANLIFHNYFIPNANSEGDFLTKMRTVNMFSKVYGTMPVMITPPNPSKIYKGTDFIVINPRRFYPQPGKYSVKDMDWLFVDFFFTKEFLNEKAQTSPEMWNPKAIEELTQKEPGQDSLTVEERRSGSMKKKYTLRGYFTKAGDWTLYEPQSRTVVLSEQGFFPQLPFAEKRTIPVLDRYFGLCDFERGETSQRLLDKYSEKFMDMIDRNINPITILDPKNMVMSTVSKDNTYWFAKNGKTQEPRVLENSPQGLASFQQTQNALKANLFSLGATSDTSISRDQDLGFGKTPQALKMQGQRESARDSQDRFMQERFFEDVAEAMMGVAIHRGLEAVQIPNIQEAIEKIRSVYGSDAEQYEESEINGSLLEDAIIRYEIDEGSTMQKSDAGEKIMEMLDMVSKNPYILQDLQASGKKINWGEAIKRLAIDRGVQDWDRIIIDNENPESINGVGDEGATVEGTPEGMGQINPQINPQNV